MPALHTSASIGSRSGLPIWVPKYCADSKFWRAALLIRLEASDRAVQVVANGRVKAARALEHVGDHRRAESGADLAAEQQALDRTELQAHAPSGAVDRAAAGLVGVVTTRDRDGQRVPHRQAHFAGHRVALAVTFAAHRGGAPDVRLERDRVGFGGLLVFRSLSGLLRQRRIRRSGAGRSSEGGRQCVAAQAFGRANCHCFPLESSDCLVAGPGRLDVTNVSNLTWG